MKNIFAALALLMSIIVVAQDGIQFQKNNFGEMLEKAKKENKLIFIDAMAVWCGPCKLMDKNVFSQKPVGDYFNANFINGKFDMEKGEGLELAARYGVRSYPTYLFINGDGQLVSRNMGYMPESTFLELGKEAYAAVKNMGSMKSRFEKGEKDPDFLISIIKLHAESDYDFAKQASERYFKNKKTSEFTKEEVGYLLFAIKSVDDANYSIFKKNEKALTQHFPAQTFEQFDNQLKIQKLWDTSVNLKAQTVNDTQFLSQAEVMIGKEEAEKVLNRRKLDFYEQTENFPAYQAAALAYFKINEKADPTEQLKAAWIFSEKATDQNALRTAQQWAERSVQMRETPENSYILAKLYQKSGKNAEAKMYAEAAVRLAKQRGVDSSAAEKLLTELN